jgi:hypothetical protein
MLEGREVTRLLYALREILSQFRELPRVLRLQREIFQAKRLQRQGRHDEALRVALCTFSELSSLTAAGHLHASALLSTHAVFLDEVATQMGQPAAAREQMEQALAICEHLVPSNPKLEATLREYIAWYKHRLAQSVPLQPN